MIDLNNIVGHCIEQVSYSEVNDPDGVVHFDGFDSVDCGVHIHMTDGYVWNFRWTEDEIFEIDNGIHTHSETLESNRVKTWDVKAQWEQFQRHPVRRLELTNAEQYSGMVSRCLIEFENDQRVVIIVAEEMDLGAKRPARTNYDLGGHLYVFFDLRLLKELDFRSQQLPR